MNWNNYWIKNKCTHILKKKKGLGMLIAKGRWMSFRKQRNHLRVK